MISVVTLAHRTSTIHNRYASIHASLFSFSVSQLKNLFRGEKAAYYRTHQSELIQLGRDLAEIRSIIGQEEELEPATTIGHEFAFALDVYIIALSDSVEWLAKICDRRYKDISRLEPYTAREDWADRADYDKSVQQYKRLGRQLDHLFNRYFGARPGR